MQSLLNVGVLAVAGSALLLALAGGCVTFSPRQEQVSRRTTTEASWTTSGLKTIGVDATNPMQLMQRLRQATSLNDATDPVDAIDAALRAFEEPDPAAGTRP